MQLVHLTQMTPRTLLFPCARNTMFRSVICSHRAQLFPKLLCIYMSAPLGPQSGKSAHTSTWPDTRREEEVNEGKETYEKGHSRGRELTAYAGCNVTTQAE